MGSTIIEKIIAAHAGHPVKAGDIAWMDIDVRSARDFGGANVVKNLQVNCGDTPVDDKERTFFTFDCNAPATSAGYADNQQTCRLFSRENDIKVYDVNTGVGSHVMLEEGLVVPGAIVVGTDSHLNIMGSVGALGQGMGDADVAFVWCAGRTWFTVPDTMRVVLKGMPGPAASAKDITLAVIKRLGSKGALGRAVEFSGPAIDKLSLAGRITLASMATEMGAISAFLIPDDEVVNFSRRRSAAEPVVVVPDQDAAYVETIEIDVDGLAPQIARPGSPADVVDVATVAGGHVDSGLIGSCTNGRFEDMAAAAEILRGKQLADGFVLKIVPATAEVYDRMLEEGLIKEFRDAGALVHNPGCGGCAAGQAGIIGVGEVQVSTSNRNFPGKQGKGDTYLASPATVAATALAGRLAVPPAVTLDGVVPDGKYGWATRKAPAPTVPRPTEAKDGVAGTKGDKPTTLKGRGFPLVSGDAFIDDIDTDMIFHNRYLHITDVAQMGQYALDNLDGYKDYSERAKKGDILVVGRNFGSGSSRAQALDCFVSLGVQCIVGRSFGAIWLRNAINNGVPVIIAPELTADFHKEGDGLEVDLTTGTITNTASGKSVKGQPMFSVQMDIYQAEGVFNYAVKKG